MSSVVRNVVEAREVLDRLTRHILVDGYHVVMDLQRSRGSYLYDARSDRMILDFFTNFATCPIGYNHPKLRTIEFRERLADVATNKPANSDIYTQVYAEFVETFTRIAIPPSHGRHLFFVEGGAVAVEHGLHALAHQYRRPPQDPVLPQVRLAPHHVPQALLPRDRRGRGAGRAARRAGRRRDPEGGR